MPAVFPNGLPAVLPATVAQIERRLPAPGEIKVRMGNRVEPEDLVGKSNVQPLPLLLDIAGTLGVEPRELPRRMKAGLNQHVAFRDVLARKGRRSILAPTHGTIIEIDKLTGFIRLKPDPVPADITAAVRGYVAALEPDRSVVIETAAAVVQGMLGFGPEQWGLLRLVVTDRHDPITPDMLDARSAYSLVIGGSGITAEALRKAQQEQVKGIIVGSIEARELRDFLGPRWTGDWHDMLQHGLLLPPSHDAPTLLVTEGVGCVPMSQPIFDLLTRFDRQEALLQGHTQLGLPAQRPRLVIPLQRLPGGEATSPPALTIQPGAIVRLHTVQQHGLIGKVVAVAPRGRLASGVRTATAMVQIGADERVLVPQAALDVIEQVSA